MIPAAATIPAAAALGGSPTDATEASDAVFDSRAATLLAVVVGALLACTQLGALDLPLMLANGEVILTERAIPRTNVFSWANPEHAYLNDKWGFMAVVGFFEEPALLSALKMAFGGFLGLLLLLLARRARRGLPALGVTVLGLTMLSYRFHLRAELVSYVGLAQILLLLPQVLERRRATWLVVLLWMPVWAACHGYWYLGPLVLLAAAVGARSWFALATAALAFLAGAISPYGVANLLHPFHVLFQLSGGLGETITELRVPFVAEFSGAAPFTLFHVLALALAALALAAVVSLLRQRRLADALVLALLVLLALRIDRNLALLGLTVPLAASAFSRRPVASLLPAEVRSVGRVLPWCGLVAVSAIAGVAAGVPFIAVDRRFGVGRHEGRFPEALAARLPRGRRYVNDLSIGSYLVRARGAAFIDGNTEGYPAEFLAEYRRMLTGERTLDEVEADYDPDGYVLRHGVRTTRVMILGLFLSGRDAPVVWDGVGTLFTAELSPEEADARWSAWLREVYLPVALGWFPSADAALDEARLQTGADEADPRLWRAALELRPYEARFYAELARAYRGLGQLDPAARCNRLALRLR